MYGVVPTFQKSHFHRVYAAYGGVFIVMSVLWGWWIDGVKPDIYDGIGSVIAVIGVLIIFYYPRKEERSLKLRKLKTSDLLALNIIILFIL